MISWRYHVVSIVAVILAFGLGILAGSSVVNERFINDLQKNYDEAIRERDAALAMVALQERVAEGLRPTLVADALLGEEAVVVTMDGVEGPTRLTVEELQAAGVEVLATFELSRRLVTPESDEERASLEEVLGLSGSDPETLPGRVADALAVRFGVGSLDVDDDALSGLLATGFVTVDRDLDPEALLGIGGAGQLVVIVAGGEAPEGYPAPGVLLVPFTERLVRLGGATAAVGPRVDPYGYVAAVREASGILDCSLVTVDDVDLDAIGGITLVMGLDRYLTDPDPAFRPGGDYGIDGESLVPGVDEPPASCRV